MVARDYRYVNVSGVKDSIVGSILPMLEDNGGWMTNRIEDLAFITEAIAARNDTYRPNSAEERQDAAEFISPQLSHVGFLKDRLALTIGGNDFDFLSVSEIGDRDDVSTFDAHVLWPGIFHPMLVKADEKTEEVFLADDFRKMYHDLRRSEGRRESGLVRATTSTIVEGEILNRPETNYLDGLVLYYYKAEGGGTYQRIEEVLIDDHERVPALDMRAGVLALYVRAEGMVYKGGGLVRKWYVRTMVEPTAAKIQSVGRSVAELAFGTAEPYSGAVYIDDEAFFCPIDDPTCIRNLNWNWEPGRG